MRKTFFILVFSFVYLHFSYAQTPFEPDFIGEVAYETTDGSFELLDKEIGNLKNGVSMRSNSWNAISVYVNGATASTRFPEGTVKLIVKGVDNNSDPLAVITIYKFRSKNKSRSAEIALDNRGTLLNSKTVSKDQVKFAGKKHGSTSYLITLRDLKAGEYGITIANPNAVDEKRVIVSCFGVDQNR